ncbi:RNA polymerase II-associated protein 1-like protein [Colletotrichum chlorophyti]|uniref:RNA polymerase II-associated protein 1-like protein n=1 Tax=Colletotrichum chlorophyti TaxID=708187 RepID=A0A1Q8RN98_9PEZI|nr:RNA polymerase II-associated protein 1-like protein [Colletotrichum chlorophyti]
MSSSAPRGGERMIHQDFIARIRYSNALPPPPNPPKLLDIPNTGLASGQYTTPGFASRLAREQPLNIEVDAELGMPLDLVGMPGIFDGDESSIQAPSYPPPVHPHDRPLLRPLSTLGRAKSTTESSVSFLRRTEYISSVTPRKGAAAASGAFINPKIKRTEKRRSPEPDKDSPAAIRRKIEKSFESAERFLSNPSRQRHPSKPTVHLVQSYPLLPDPDAFPDSGAYVTVKLLTNPVASSNKYDRRLLSGLLRPLDRSPEENEAFQAAVEAHERDPVRNPKPANLMDYSFFLPATQAAAENFRAKFDPENPDHDDDSLYTHKSQGTDGCFQFSRLRAYETTKETELDHSTKYSEEVILAFNDEPSATRQKAVYYYPVIQRTTIRPQRAKNIARTLSQVEDQTQVVNEVEVSVVDPKGAPAENMKRYKEKPIGFVDEATEEAFPSVEGNEEGAAPGTPSDRDADGDEEDDD